MQTHNPTIRPPNLAHPFPCPSHHPSFLAPNTLGYGRRHLSRHSPINGAMLYITQTRFFPPHFHDLAHDTAHVERVTSRSFEPWDEYKETSGTSLPPPASLFLNHRTNKPPQSKQPKCNFLPSSQPSSPSPPSAPPPLWPLPWSPGPAHAIRRVSHHCPRGHLPILPI